MSPFANGSCCKNSVFSLLHGSFIGVPKQWNTTLSPGSSLYLETRGRERTLGTRLNGVVPNQFCGSSTLFLCKRFLCSNKFAWLLDTRVKREDFFLITLTFCLAVSSYCIFVQGGSDFVWEPHGRSAIHTQWRSLPCRGEWSTLDRCTSKQTLWVFSLIC